MVTKREKNEWTWWELQQRARKYKKVSKSHKAEEYNNNWKIQLRGFNSRLDEANNELLGKQENGTHLNRAQKGKLTLKNKDSLRQLWDDIKQNNTHTIKDSEGEEREKGK